ncbi:yjgP [Wigglesworthia glossinidia endosymbiont of Glossina brevipalpis]|uniref:Lipopolysaccharide export system permease protein LptF n=1 Tax=Wigglesworthia glossinidia brevipalpis TaxID=36870 RepID=Q8D296_WIGBR|nr:yjgP [Wigglesworthia glossinidia endosymbiont of Glossina brevipalpis]
MIILKYLIKKILKSQFHILCILFLIFFCQKLVRILSSMSEELIPKKIIFFLLILYIPEIIKLILPLSLFISIALVMQKLHNSNEIISIKTCGIGNECFIKVILFLNLLVMSFSFVNVMWISPLALNYKHKIISYNLSNIDKLKLNEKQFKFIKDKNIILFVDNIKDKNLKNIFIVKFILKNKEYIPVVFVSKHGSLYKDLLKNKNVINLNYGEYYEIDFKSNYFFIASFERYQIELFNTFSRLKEPSSEYVYFKNLFNSCIEEYKLEYNWRITIVFSVLIMSIISFALNIKKLGSGQFFNLFLGIFFYLIFFISQTFIYSNHSLFKLHSIFFMWIINFIYIFFSIALYYNNIKKIFS